MCAGYKTITPIKLLNAVSAYQNKAISFKALRVYIACFELEAIREAAKRSQNGKQPKNAQYVSFQKTELIRATGGLTLRSIGKSLSELKRAGLLIFKERGLIFTDTPIEGVAELIEIALGGRKGTRVIPVPRRLIKYLAKLNKPALFLTIIAYILRGISIDRRSGEVKTKGAVKASLISDTFGISLRAVKGARAEMIALGIISKDVNSYQRKLNRDGAYFELNLEWSKAEGRGEKEAQPVDNFATPKTSFAPPRAQKCTEFAPPKERLKTSKEYKNQKTRGAEPSGVCKQTFEKSEKPNIRNIQYQDFRKLSRNEELYWQARKVGLISGSEADVLNWLAASVRARETENPARIFIGILKKKLFHHITHAQEEQARKALNRRRDKYPNAYREYQPQELAA